MTRGVSKEYPDRQGREKGWISWSSQEQSRSSMNNTERRRSRWRWEILAVAYVWLAGYPASTNDTPEVLDGEHWRKQGLEDFIPHWYRHLKDTPS